MQKEIPASNGSNTEFKVPTRVLIVGDKLNEPTRSRLQGRTLLVDDFKVDGICSLRTDSAHFPRGGVANTNLCLANRSSLLVRRHGMANQSTDLELLGSLQKKGKI